MFFGLDPGSKQAFMSRHSAKYFPSLTAPLRLPWVAAAGAGVRRAQHRRLQARALGLSSKDTLSPSFQAETFFLSSPVGANAGFHVFPGLPQLICSRPAFPRYVRARWDGDTCPGSAVGKRLLPDWKTTARAGLGT